MALILCSSCNRHIFHPESGGDDACPFCATPVLVARVDSTTAVATGNGVGATLLAALIAVSAMPGCWRDAPSPVYGLPITDEYDDSDADSTSDGSAADAESNPDASADGSSNGSGDSDE
jgi:hypothetical protein